MTRHLHVIPAALSIGTRKPSGSSKLAVQAPVHTTTAPTVSSRSSCVGRPPLEWLMARISAHSERRASLRCGTDEALQDLERIEHMSGAGNQDPRRAPPPIGVQ